MVRPYPPRGAKPYDTLLKGYLDDREKRGQQALPTLDAGVEFGVSSGLDADSNGSRLVAAVAAATEGGFEVLLPEGNIAIPNGLRVDDSTVRIRGRGSSRTRLIVGSAASDGLILGSGVDAPDTAHYGWISDFAVVGPTRPAKTGFAVLKLDSVKFATVERLYINGGDIALDMVGNNYGTSITDCSLGRYGESNVGLNIRTGIEQGADLPLINCWIHGGAAGLHVSPGSQNTRIYGGQLSTQDQAPGGPAIDHRAAVILGKDYITGATGEHGAVTIFGTDFEHWQGWAIRSYAEVFQLAVYSSAFIASQEDPAKMARGVIKMTDPRNSHVTFGECEVRGKYAEEQLAVTTGTVTASFYAKEDGWFSKGSSTVGATYYPESGWLHAGIFIRGGQARSGGTAALDHRVMQVLGYRALRMNDDGGFEFTNDVNDPAPTWEALNSPPALFDYGDPGDAAKSAPQGTFYVDLNNNQIWYRTPNGWQQIATPRPVAFTTDVNAYMDAHPAANNIGVILADATNGGAYGVADFGGGNYGWINFAQGPMFPATLDLNGADAPASSITVVDDGSDTATWPNRWEWLYKAAGAAAKLVQWTNEYGELRLVPAKVNTVAFRIFGKTTTAEAAHVGNLMEIQDDRQARNNLFAVDGAGNTTVKATLTAGKVTVVVPSGPTLNAGYLTLATGAAVPANTPTGTLIVRTA